MVSTQAIRIRVFSTGTAPAWGPFALRSKSGPRATTNESSQNIGIRRLFDPGGWIREIRNATGAVGPSLPVLTRRHPRTSGDVSRLLQWIRWNPATGRPKARHRRTPETEKGASGAPLKKIRKDGGQGWIRTSEGICQQIYSLPRLAAPEPTLLFCGGAG